MILCQYTVCQEELGIYKVKLATLFRGEPKGLFLIATTQRCSGENYSIPWIASLYSWFLPWNAEC